MKVINIFKYLNPFYFYINILYIIFLIDPTTRRYFMVLQYANGGNLRDFLNERHESLNWEQRINMASQIAGGLKCIHERNIVHRDLVSDGSYDT